MHDRKKQTCYLPTGLNVTAGETRQVTTSDDVRSVGWRQGVSIMNLCISSVVKTCGPWRVGISDPWIARVLTLLSLTLSSFLPVTQLRVSNRLGPLLSAGSACLGYDPHQHLLPQQTTAGAVSIQH